MCFKSIMNIVKIIKILEEAYENGNQLSVIYTNSWGDTNEYIIWEVEIDSDYGSGKINEDGYIRAYCGTFNDEEFDDYYTFKISRFNYVEIID